MDIQRLVIAKPSGNVTALVFDETAPENKREIGAIIQEEYPSVEQVLFVEKRGGLVYGQMAGGEFCGNAARSLGYILAAGTSSQQTFAMSGSSAPIMVETSAGYAKLKMQTRLEREWLSLANTPVAAVHLEGISHAILQPEHPLFSTLREQAARPDRWNAVKHLFDELGLAARPACGLVFAETKDTFVHITPYVFVRDIETLCAETACASGSIAVASVLEKNISLHQPSGEVLDVTLQRSGNLAKAEVGGSMSIIWDGPATGLYGLQNVERGSAFWAHNKTVLLPVAKAG